MFDKLLANRADLAQIVQGSVAGSNLSGTCNCLTLLHTERPKLYGVLAVLIAIGLIDRLSK